MVPEPFIAHPLNCSLIYGNMTEIRVIEMNLATNIINATFEYAQNKTGPWTLIEVDTNATDRWRAYWNLTLLGEGEYYIRVTMVNNISKTGEDQAHVYFDPTPPIPQLIKPTFPVIVHGVTTLTATTKADDIVNSTFDYIPWPWENKPIWNNCYSINKSLPKVAVIGCSPSSAASCLAYWDAQEVPFGSGKYPYEDIYDERDRDGLTKLAKKLAELSQTKDGITFDKELVDGINAYINSISSLKGKLIAKLRPREPDTGSSDPPATLEYAIEEFLRCQDVLLTFKGEPGHTVAMSSVHFVKLRAPWITMGLTGKIDFMDPGKGGETGEGEIVGEDKLKGDFPWLQGEYASLDGVITVCPILDYPWGFPWGEVGIGRLSLDGNWSVKWDTTELPDGYYLIKATMRDAANNTGIDTMLVYINNAKITNITTPKTVLRKHETTHVNVSIENQHFNPVYVTLYCGKIQIGTQNLTLNTNDTSTITFMANTDDLLPGENTLRAVAIRLFNETYRATVEYVYGAIVVLTAPGGCLRWTICLW